MLPTDSEIQDLILKLAAYHMPFTSPTCMPYIMQAFRRLATNGLMVTCLAASHMKCMAVDAWVVTMVFMSLYIAFLWLIASSFDRWKWGLLRQHVEAPYGTYVSISLLPVDFGRIPTSRSPPHIILGGALSESRVDSFVVPLQMHCHYLRRWF